LEVIQQNKTGEIKMSKPKVKIFKEQYKAIEYILTLKAKGIDSDRCSYLIENGFHKIYVFSTPIFKK
jgi:hypothetical protein